MHKRDFLKGSAAAAAAVLCKGMVQASAAPDAAVPRTNWAGNFHYSTDKVLQPASTAEAQDAVRSLPHARALGTRHAFNGIADSTSAQISTLGLKDVSIDHAARTVTVAPASATAILPCSWTAPASPCTISPRCRTSRSPEPAPRPPTAPACTTATWPLP